MWRQARAPLAPFEGTVRVRSALCAPLNADTSYNLRLRTSQGIYVFALKRKHMCMRGPLFSGAGLRIVNEAAGQWTPIGTGWSAFALDEEDRKLKQVIEHYRSLAADAQEAAAAATEEKYRKAYRKMAKHWVELAREIEECLGWPEGALH
jgi:hypothetical protein